MKKINKEWIKKQLIVYLDDNNKTINIPSTSYKQRLGIVKKEKNFKEHWHENIDNFLREKYTVKTNQPGMDKFLSFLFNKREENRDAVLEFFKQQSPLNNTKELEDGEIVVKDSRYEYNEYQRIILDILHPDETMLFDYIGNLRFMLGQKDTVFKYIKSYFSLEKVDCLVEIYLNAKMMKSLEFEREIFNLLKEKNLLKKYGDFLPNLKEGVNNFDASVFEMKEMTSFKVFFSEDSLLKQLSRDKSLSKVFQEINNLRLLSYIKDLGIESCSVPYHHENNKTKELYFQGENLNTAKLKVAIAEFVKIILKEDSDKSLNELVGLYDHQINSERFSTDCKRLLEAFEIRLNKIYLKENLQRDLVKDEVSKNKVLKI